MRVCPTHTHTPDSLSLYNGSTVLTDVLKLMNMYIAYVQVYVYVRVRDQVWHFHHVIYYYTPRGVSRTSPLQNCLPHSDRQDWDHTGVQLVGNMM